MMSTDVYDVYCLVSFRVVVGRGTTGHAHRWEGHTSGLCFKAMHTNGIDKFSYSQHHQLPYYCRTIEIESHTGCFSWKPHASRVKRVLCRGKLAGKARLHQHDKQTSRHPSHPRKNSRKACWDAGATLFCWSSVLSG